MYLLFSETTFCSKNLSNYQSSQADITQTTCVDDQKDSDANASSLNHGENRFHNKNVLNFLGKKEMLKKEKKRKSLFSEISDPAVPNGRRQMPTNRNLNYIIPFLKHMVNLPPQGSHFWGIYLASTQNEKLWCHAGRRCTRINQMMGVNSARCTLGAS